MTLVLEFLIQLGQLFFKLTICTRVNINMNLKETWGTIWILEYVNFNPFQLLDKFCLIYNNIKRYVKPQLCARSIETPEIKQRTTNILAVTKSYAVQTSEKDRQVIRAIWCSTHYNRGHVSIKKKKRKVCYNNQVDWLRRTFQTEGIWYKHILKERELFLRGGASEFYTEKWWEIRQETHLRARTRRDGVFFLNS